MRARTIVLQMAISASDHSWASAFSDFKSQPPDVSCLRETVPPACCACAYIAYAYRRKPWLTDDRDNDLHADIYNDAGDHSKVTRANAASGVSSNTTQANVVSTTKR